MSAGALQIAVTRLTVAEPYYEQVASRLAGIIALDARVTLEEIAYVTGLLETMPWRPQAARELRALLEQSDETRPVGRAAPVHANDAFSPWCRSPRRGSRPGS